MIDGSNLYFHDLNNFSQTNHIRFDNPLGNNRHIPFACSQESGRIAFYYDKKMLLYSDLSLTNPILINYDIGTSIKGVTFSSNNLLYYLYRNDVLNEIKIHNASTGELMYSIVLEEEIPNIYTISFSKDGKYLIYAVNDYFCCYKLNINSAEKLYQSNISFGDSYEILFNPLNSEEFIIRHYYSGTFNICNTKDFSIIKTFDGYNPYFDPYTGKLVYITYENYYYTKLIVSEPGNYEQLLSISTTDDRKIIIVNDHIIASSNHYASINNFIE